VTRRWVAPALAVLAWLAGGTATCRADLQLQVGSALTDSPGIGSFDVTITNTDQQNSSVAIGGFNYTITAGTGVTLNAATTTTGIVGAPTYIFAGNSFADAISSGSLDGSGVLPGSSVVASDLALTPNSGTTLSAGETLDMGRFFFTVDQGVPVGTVIPVTLSDVSLTDASGASIIAFNLGAQGGLGGLTVTPAPSTTVPVVICLMALAGKAARSLRRHPRPPAIA
jgi:hypothetical protein